MVTNPKWSTFLLLIALLLMGGIPGTSQSARAESNPVALPIISAPPAPGFSYSIIQTVDTNTGRTIWLVYQKQTFWSEYWKQVIGAVTTAIIGLGGWMLKGRVAELFGRNG